MIARGGQGRRLALRALVLGLLVLGAGPLGRSAAGDEDPAIETRRLLARVRKGAGDDEAGWRDALARLRAGSEEARLALDALLRKMAKDRRRALGKTTDRIDALAAKVGDGRRAARARTRWEASRASAVAWILDETAFPVPVEVVITGPKEGYAEAKARGDQAMRDFGALSRSLDRALAPALKLSRRRAEKLEAEDATARSRYLRVADELEDAEPAPVPGTLARLLLDTRLGRLEGVVEAYAAMEDGWPRLCLYRALCQGVLDHNEAHPYDMRSGAVAGIHAINELRIALGISPLRHEPRLVRAAFKHSEEMTKRGYFSHRSPVPGRETKEQRVALEGYDAQVVECITGVGGGEAAREFWRYDGGHHRDMCNPEVVEAGFSTRGPSVYVGGKGGSGHLPGFRY